MLSINGKLLYRLRRHAARIGGDCLRFRARPRELEVWRNMQTMLDAFPLFFICIGLTGWSGGYSPLHNYWLSAATQTVSRMRTYRYLQLTNQSIFTWAWIAKHRMGNLTAWPELNLLWERVELNGVSWVGVISICVALSILFIRSESAVFSQGGGNLAQFTFINLAGVKMLLTHNFVKLHQSRSQ